jgi:hypothetical protein
VRRAGRPAIIIIIIIIMMMMMRGIRIPTMTTTMMLSDSMGARRGSRSRRMIIYAVTVGVGGGGARGLLEIWSGSREERLGCSLTPS